MELNFTKDVKENKMGFFKYNNRRKAKDNVGPVTKWRGHPDDRGHRQGRITENCLWTGVCCQDQPSGISDQEIRVKECWKEYFPLVKEDCV